MAARSSAPRSRADAGSLARRDWTACALRSSSGAPSRNAYGLAFRISCERGEGLWRVARHETNAAGVNARQHAGKTAAVHPLVEAVAYRLRHQWVIGNLAISGNVLEARGGIRKHRRQQIVGEHALQRRRNLPPSAEPRHGE
jgi:hypothetical protein